MPENKPYSFPLTAKQKQLNELATFFDEQAVQLRDGFEFAIMAAESAIKKQAGAACRVSDIFSKVSASQNVFAVLSQWNVKNSGSSAVMKHDIDPHDFTPKDIAKLAPQFKALHDLGLEYNVDLSICGFDMQPRQATRVGVGTIYTRGIGVAVNDAKPYDVESHPSYDGQNKDIIASRLNCRFK